MEHRKMPKLGANPALLGFGCMRLPVDQAGRIREREAAAMIRQAMEGGINYYDTAYTYHKGESERFLGRILPQYPRDSYYLATKLPVWLVESLEDAKKYFEEQLEKLRQKRIDFYLLHSLDRERWERMQKLGVLDYLEEQRRQGRIRWLGFSFHDVFETFREILTARDWDFCQIQLNYVDTRYQAGLAGLALARERGIPVVVMEPVKGGSLAQLPGEIQEPLNKLRPKDSPAAWALRWVASQPGVHVILSGMSTQQQLEENLALFHNLSPLTSQESGTLEQAARLLAARVKNGCTGCKYCLPCPQGVNIPRCFSIWNDYAKFGNADAMRQDYFSWMDAEERADRCIGCHTCEARCPQRIPICQDLKRVAAELKP